MNISFDLDSTLIPSGNEFETENRNWLARFLGIEKLRKGTPELVTFLHQQGHHVHIYTTSFRPKWKIRLFFFYYSIRVHRIVNQSENQKTLTSRNIKASKHPRTFNFDLHIDDSKGVELEGKHYQFNVILVDPKDSNWKEKIIGKLASY